MPAGIELFYWPTPNGWKISIALEEMGLPYRVRLVNIGTGEQFTPDFLKVAPNNRMPAIIDPDGPDAAPISVFESGAILQYLARKTGQFCGTGPRQQVAVEQWLMWQMGGVGPMAGQAHHFLKYAPALEPPQDLPYAKNRYRAEVGRLYGVLIRQLAHQDFVADAYSIADMAIWPWVLDRQLAHTEFAAGDFLSIADFAIWPWATLWQGQEQLLDDKPNLARWLDQLAARPGFIRGRAVAADQRSNLQSDRKAQEILFGRQG